MEKKTFIKLQIAFFVIAALWIGISVDSKQIITWAEILRRILAIGFCFYMALMNLRLHEAIEEEN